LIFLLSALFMLHRPPFVCKVLQLCENFEFFCPELNDSLKRKLAKIGIKKKIFKKSPDLQKST